MRLLDTMIFRYFYDADLLDKVLGLPRLGLTTAVRREARRNWPEIGDVVDRAIEDGRLAVCDIDPDEATEGILYFRYRDVEGFGDGEATSMAVSFARGCSFVSHDLRAAARIRRLGVKVRDWPDLLEELSHRGMISASRCARAKRHIQGMMKGR